MSSAAAGRAVAGAVRSGPATQAEKDALARKLAAAQQAQRPEKPVEASPAPAPQPAPVRPPATRSGGRAPAWGRRTGGTVAGNGAGFLLGLLVWGWIVLPLVRGGPAEVRNVIRAKFLNKAPDGSWLP
jgi:hypothetical protein